MAQRQPSALQLKRVHQVHSGQLAVFRARAHVFCPSSNHAVTAAAVMATPMLALGARGIELGLDIYEADEEVRNAQCQ